MPPGCGAYSHIVLRRLARLWHAMRPPSVPCMSAAGCSCCRCSVRISTCGARTVARIVCLGPSSPTRYAASSCISHAPLRHRSRQSRTFELADEQMRNMQVLLHQFREQG